MYESVLVQVRLSAGGTYVITTTDYTEDGEEISVTETVQMGSEN
jgi:hypothetical protein